MLVGSYETGWAMDLLALGFAGLGLAANTGVVPLGSGYN